MSDDEDRTARQLELFEAIERLEAALERFEVRHEFRLILPPRSWVEIRPNPAYL